jgi:hypothetical protein
VRKIVMANPSILFVGDTILDTSDDSNPLEHVGNVWNQHDLIVLNLETPVVEECLAQKMKAVNFRIIPSTLKWLTPFKDKLVVALANNHILDCGTAGYEETLEHLRDAEISSVPLDRPFSTTVCGLVIKIFALYKGINNEFQRSFFERSLSAGGVFSRDEFPIAFCHWGDEYVILPNPRIVDMVGRLHKMGFRAIVGHHSHSAQGVSVHADGCITAYSLGNFNFLRWNDHERESLLRRLGYMLALEAGTRPLVWKRYPCVIDQFWRPVPIDFEFVEQYFLDIDRILSQYVSRSNPMRYLIYLKHSSRLIMKSNLMWGWLPRIRKGGVRQCWLMLKWLAYHHNIARLPFTVFRSDWAWMRYLQLVKEWFAYVRSDPSIREKIG